MLKKDTKIKKTKIKKDKNLHIRANGKRLILITRWIKCLTKDHENAIHNGGLIFSENIQFDKYLFFSSAKEL